MNLLKILLVVVLSHGLYAIKRTQLIEDFSFENGTNSIYWVQSNAYGMNSDAAIGTTSNPAPYQGNYCAFANVYPDNNLNLQLYKVGQNITFPKGGNSTLSLYYNFPYPVDNTNLKSRFVVTIGNKIAVT